MAEHEHQADREQKTTDGKPDGPPSDNSGTAGPGNTGVRSATPENSTGHIDPSAPGNTGTTPGSNAS